MTPERFKQIERLFHSALELPPPKRGPWLEQACGEDEELRRQVESLLRFHANGGTAGSSVLPGQRTGPVPVPQPGDVIGDYEIVEKIGGNLGLVFKARHRRLDKLRALKLLPADWTSDPARVARFERELRVMGRLDHPNLVTASDARIEGCWHLVAMELIEGLDLERLVEARGPLSLNDACEAGRQTALGLEELHRCGLIHRDIKPSNLMLTRAGMIRVIDLGLALTKRDLCARLTEPGLVMGTVSYCAPEQFSNAAEVDIGADLYSLGCTIFHLLAGKPPYWQKTTIAELIQAHLTEPFPSILEERPDVPAEFEGVLGRMTAKDRAGRFSTPNEAAGALKPFALGADLESLLSGRRPKVLPAGNPGSRTGTPPSGPGKNPHQGDDGPRRRNRREPPGIPGTRTGVPPSRPRKNSRRADDGPRRRNRRLAAALAVLVAVAAAVFFWAKFWPGHMPVIVLMDTMAEGGTYEKYLGGGTNATEIIKVLSDLPVEPVEVKLDHLWGKEAHVLSLDPHLILIHRSAFFHAYNEILKFGPPPAGQKLEGKWKDLYEIADDKLLSVIGFLGKFKPRTKFLVYSRGTDIQWEDEAYRTGVWVPKLEVRFKELTGRVETMVITGVREKTFKDPQVALEIRRRVRAILGLPETPEDVRLRAEAAALRGQTGK